MTELFALKEPRREYKCRTKRKKGPGNCDQLLYQSDKEKYASGKFKVLNAEDGRGGGRDEPHVCPDRFDSEFDHTNKKVNWTKYHYEQEHKMCTMCAEEFNSYRNPLCPSCYRLRCRKCGNMQQWIVFEGMQTRCFMCKHEHLDVEQIWNAYQRLYGKYEF
jgi:hypothetical protein